MFRNSANVWVAAIVEHVIEDIIQIKTFDQPQKQIEDWVDIYTGYIAPYKSKQQKFTDVTEIEDSGTEYVTTNETSEKDNDSREGDGNKSDASNSSIRAHFGP